MWKMISFMKHLKDNFVSVLCQYSCAYMVRQNEKSIGHTVYCGKKEFLFPITHHFSEYQ